MPIHHAKRCHTFFQILASIFLLSQIYPLQAQSQQGFTGEQELIEALLKGNTHERRLATDSLKKLGEQAAYATPALIRAWSDEDRYVRNNAYDAALKIAVAVSTQWQKDNPAKEETQARLDIINTALNNELKHDNFAYRSSAISIITEMGDAAEPTYPALASLMEIDDGAIRVDALLAMQSKAVNYLVVHAKNWANREDAGGERAFRITLTIIVELDSFQEIDKDKLYILNLALYRKEPKLRQLGARGLGNMKGKAASSVNRLVELLYDPWLPVQIASMEALKDIGESALPSMLELMNRDDIELSRYATGTIGEIYKDSTPKNIEHQPYLDALLFACSDREADETTQNLAISSLGHMAAHAVAATPQLIQYLSHDHLAFRLAAANALSNIHTALINSLHDSNKKLAENLTMIGFYGLPLDYLNNFKARIESVTLVEVNDAFRRRVNPENMVTIIVGPDKAPKTAVPADKK